MKNIIYKIGTSLALLLGFTLVLGTVPVQGAEFVKGDENGKISITDKEQKRENLYLASSNVILNAPVSKDLYVAGSDLSISSEVERSGFLAGSSIKVMDSKFGAGLKIVGSTIVIENTTITEDLFVAGSNLTLKNVTIKGDLLVAGSRLTMTDSVVEKNLYYSGSKNDTLKDQVKGSLYLDVDSESMEAERKQNEINRMFNFSYIDVMFLISGLVILIFEVSILNKYNKLWDPKIGFSKGGRSFAHLGYGVLAFVGIFGLLIFSVLSAGLLAPLFINLAIILSLLFFLLAPLSSYYLGNLIFDKNIKWWHCFVIFITIAFLTYLPVVGWIFSLIMNFVNLMTIGYYLSKAWNSKITELKQPQDLLGETVKITSDLN
jgi:hypothetical protein